MPEQVLRLACPCGGPVFCRADAAVPTGCGFCQATLTPATLPPHETSSDPSSPSYEAPVPPPAAVRRRLFVAEIVCLLCGRETGTAAAEHWPPNGPILFQPPDALTPSVL